MTPPRNASIDGLHGLPVVEGKTVRVLLDGDMLRGIVSFDADEVPIAIVETKATLDRFVIVVEWL